jgi:hypothetical protein
MISAWATFVFIIFNFFCVDEFDVLEATGNQFDLVVTKKTRMAKAWARERVWRILPQSLKTDKPFSFDAVEKIAFTLSDQQLITGTSILIVGFSRHCVITQYHFNIVYLLGVFSFVTHQSTMMIVAKKLREFHWMRWWRLVAIFGIFALSFVANIVVYNGYFLADYGLVTQCVWSSLPKYYTEEDSLMLALNSVFLAWGLGAVVRDTWPEFGKMIRKVLVCVMPLLDLLDPITGLLSPRTWRYFTRRKLADAAQAGIHKKRWWSLNLISSAVFIIFFSIIQILTSTFFDLYRIWITLYLTTQQVLALRDNASKLVAADGSQAMKGNENTWGFGQILPMLLLALPISQIWEMVFGIFSFVFERSVDANCDVEDIENRKQKRRKEKGNTEHRRAKVPSRESSIIETSQDNTLSMLNTPVPFANPQPAAPREEISEFYHITSTATDENFRQAEHYQVGTDVGNGNGAQSAHTPPTSAARSLAGKQIANNNT